MLSSNLPGVRVTAEHYPPSYGATVASSFITAAQWAVILGAFGGASLAEMAAGTPLAAPLAYVQENRMSSVGMAWFMGGSLSASMLKTGAFEVQVRGGGEAPYTVWSGIKRGGRPPATMQEMHEIIQALRLAGAGRRAPSPTSPMSRDDDEAAAEAAASIEEAEM